MDFSDTTTAAQAKENGDAAYKAGRFEEAIEHFTKAVHSPEEDFDLLAKVYSNRCAAYMKIKKLKEAKEDAESCTQTKPTWAKGWTRLAACEESLGDFNASLTAWRKAIELEPSNKNHVASKNAVEAKKARREAPPVNAYYSPGTTPRTAPGSMRLPHLVLQLAMFISAAIYMFYPTTNSKFLSKQFSMCLKFYLGSAIISFFQNHGIPKFNSQYLQECLSDAAVQRLFGSICLFLGPNFMGLIALLIPEAANFASSWIQLLKKWKMTSIASKINGVLAGRILDSNGYPLSLVVAQYAAHAEVGAGILFFLSLATPRRNLIQLIIYLQFLQIRYLIENALLPHPSQSYQRVLHMAFTNLDSKITKFLPSFIMPGYKMIKGLLARQVQLPEKGKKPSMCTVM